METEKKSHGGKREGAGRKPTGLPTVKQRAVAFTDADWETIKTLAQKNNMSTSKFILHCVNKFTLE